jgi:predicted DNA-binding transcriptional regulator YafY
LPIALRRRGIPATLDAVSKGPGRDAREAMERLVRLASVLHHAGERGVPAANLLEVAGWSEAADGVSALKRDFRHLAALGWQIDNIAEQGLNAIYRMRTVDNRLRVRLSPEQQAALRRAVLLVDRADLADRLGLVGADKPAEVVATLQAGDLGALDTVVRALRGRALLRFRYKGTERVVHPESVRTYTTSWYLRGREDGDEVVKTYAVGRMLDVRADAPGTAERPEVRRHTGLHPMTWEIDPPVDVTLQTAPEYVADVRRWLGDPVEPPDVELTPDVELVETPAPVEPPPDVELVETPAPASPTVTLTYRVTNRAAFRARIYQLGTRVTVVGPEEIRKEILHELATMAGE